MNSDDFYTIFSKYTHFLTEAGFKKKTKNRFEKGDIVIKFNLDKWGWMPETGWGFQIMMYDYKDIDKSSYGQPKRAAYIRPSVLINEHFVTKEDLVSVNMPYATMYRERFSLLDSPMFLFFNKKHLDALLQCIMPSIAHKAAIWSEQQ